MTMLKAAVSDTVEIADHKYVLVKGESFECDDEAAAETMLANLQAVPEGDEILEAEDLVKLTKTDEAAAVVVEDEA